jgi:hypothetical protein
VAGSTGLPTEGVIFFFGEVGQVEEERTASTSPGVTAKGVPFAELTQPAAVSLLGSFS